MSSSSLSTEVVVAPFDVTAADLENLSLDSTPSPSVDQGGQPSLAALTSPSPPDSVPTLSSIFYQATTVLGPAEAPSPAPTPHDAPHPPLREKSSSRFSSIRAAVSRSSGDSSEVEASSSSPGEASSLSPPASTLPDRDTPSLNSVIRTAPGVKIILVNQTGLQLEMASWHVRAEDGELCALQSYQGQDLMEHLVPSAGVSLGSQEVIDVGLLRKPEKGMLKNGHTHGWIYFDLLVLPPPSSISQRPYRIHGQAFLRLSSSGRAKAYLGRFDLDSSEDHPMPSGHFGRVEVLRASPSQPPHLSRTETSSSALNAEPANSEAKDEGEGEVVEVRFFLTPEVAEVKNDVDDSIKKGSFLRPKKRVSVSTWVSHSSATVSLRLHNEARYHEHHVPPSPHGTPSRLGQVRVSHHQLEGFDWRNCFVFVHDKGQNVFDRTVKINSRGGVVGAKMASTVDTPAHFDPGRQLCINYGFYDSGLLRSKQIYIYVSHLHTRWLGDLLAMEPRTSEVPFEQLVLAGSHDAGMLGRINLELLEFIESGRVDNDVPNVAMAMPFVRFVLAALKTFKVTAHRMLENMANTQKDSIPSQLEMGVRYFDFRPGYSLFDVFDGVHGSLRHQHAIVPGVQYEMFLVDILSFLAANPQEIVFFEIKSDVLTRSSGFAILADIADSETSGKAALSMVPTLEALEACLESARQSANGLAAREIRIGGPVDLGRTIGDLLETNTRLIIANRVHFPDAWERGDSYSHEAYDTDDPAKVEAALEATHEDATRRAAKGEGPRATIYQLQATPTADIWADVGASLTYSDASSLLVSSKAKLDRVTYAWIASKTFVEPGNVVFLNDFVDGALVEHAVEKSSQRISVYLARMGAAK